MMQQLNVKHQNAYGEIEHNKTYQIEITGNDGKPLKEWEFAYVIEQMNEILNNQEQTPEPTAITWHVKTKSGKELPNILTMNTQAGYDQAGRAAQAMANKEQTTVEFTPWINETEGATAYRYPRKTKAVAKHL